MRSIFFLFVLASVNIVGRGQSSELGNQQLYYERYQSAEATFHMVLRSDPSDAFAWHGLTLAYLHQGKVDKSEDSIKQAPETVQQSPYYKVAYASVLLMLGRKEEASGFFNDVLKETKEKNPAILSAVASSHILAAAGDANYAIGLLNKAVKRDKRNPALYVQLGDAWRKLLNGTEAFKAYQKAIAEDDKYAAAYHKTAEIFLTQKNTELYTEYFRKAVAADPAYSPSFYKLYIYKFNRNPVNAMTYYKEYLKNADQSYHQEYDMTDLLYLTGQYEPAIAKARQIIKKYGTEAKPRLYKLMGYSYAASGDTLQALSGMRQYFSYEADSNFISKDYETMAGFYAAIDGRKDSAMLAYEHAAQLEKDSLVLAGYYKKLAELAKNLQDYKAQARWLAAYYNTDSDNASNLDLFNLGLAYYRAEDYTMSDSVFRLYSARYPDQAFGYYWQARSKSLLDKEMKEGLAVPAYRQLIEVLQKDTINANYKKWMIEAYGYLAAYEANTEKDYAEAIGYFEEILELDPENESVKKYVAMLEKDMGDKSSK